MLPTKQLYLDLTLKSYIVQLLPCFILTTCYYIYKNLMKYQSRRLNHIIDLELVAKDTMPSTYPEPNLILLATKVNNKSRLSTVKNLLAIPPIEKTQMKQIELEPVCADWIVVTEKKKNARTVVKEKKPKTKPKKTNNNKQNKANNNNIKVIKPKAIIQQTTTPVLSSQPWSNVVKCSNRQEEEELIIQDDLPSLSDNESTTGSIESPCLSYKDLSHDTSVVVEEKYYSPFSTGFDFGVLPSLRSKHDKSMDKYYLPATRTQSYYTQQQNTPHKTSILNLLNQSDQVETTITPTSFKYFDDMMMSTSLYHTTDDTNHLSLMNSNKRVWDAINYIR
ncbi:hypothetical protein INT48_009458 [Thamnidium elegans]|uniref:Uncharacterized protein n=1 Tax=Thamnidium elegans TaxID=101142 RepID=A0A8H7VN47_9FUNG|nr:hypothetical protein INT48_009458 [Thamnidium elegans]